MHFLKNIEKQEKKFCYLITTALNLAKKNDSTAEITIKKTFGIHVSTRYGKSEFIEFNNDSIISVTIYKDYSKSTVTSTNISLGSIKKVVLKALDMVRYTSKDSFSGLPDPELLQYKYIDLDLFYPWEIDIDYAIKLASIAEESALKVDARISNTEGGVFNGNITIKAFGNTYGMLQSYKTSIYSISSSVIAKEKDEMQRDYAYSISRNILTLNSPVNIGKESGQKTILRLGSRELKTMKSLVVFSSEIACDFFLHLAQAIDGTKIYQKSTFLLDCLNKLIFPDWLNIYEHPQLEGGLGSKSFDREGVSTNPMYIVKNGILKTWLLNSYASRKLNLKTTGHDGGIHNWIISSNDSDKNKKCNLLHYMIKGLFVTDLMGDGINIVTGDYSRGASGFWIEQGKIQYPVHGITISGNLKNIFKTIVCIGNDIKPVTRVIQSPSILLSEMQISGT